MAHPETLGGTDGARSPSEPPARLPVFRYTVTTESPRLRDMRQALAHWLASHGADPPVADRVVLACSEVVANGLEHGCRDLLDCEVRLVAVLHDGVVDVRVEDPGRWDASPSQPYRGHGLDLVRRLMDEVDVTSRNGTVVTMRRRVRDS